MKKVPVISTKGGERKSTQAIKLAGTSLRTYLNAGDQCYHSLNDLSNVILNKLYILLMPYRYLLFLLSPLS